MHKKEVNSLSKDKCLTSDTDFLEIFVIFSCKKYVKCSVSEILKFLSAFSLEFQSFTLTHY